MLNDITFGQFYPTNSIIHRIDPRVKIILTVVLMVSLFFAENFYAFAVIGALCIAVIIMSKVPITYFLKSFKPLLFVIVFTAILNVFLTDGRIIWKYGFVEITYEGIIMALFMAIRLLLLITATSILTLTTSPIMLTDGLERLMSPLKKVRFPAHEIAMMMSIALRFIPTLLEETDKIIKAQSARGADFASGNLLKKAKAVIPILVPLFISAFRRADELALAMECRCYNGGDHRTRMRQLKISKRDIVSMILTLLACSAAVTLSIVF